MITLLGKVILVVGFFSFHHFNISCQSVLVSTVSAEKSVYSLMGVPLHITCCFSLAAFNILSLSFNFCHFIYSVSWCGPLWIDLFWDSLYFMGLAFSFLSQVREVSTIIFSNKSSAHFSLLFLRLL